MFIFRPMKVKGTGGSRWKRKLVLTNFLFLFRWTTTEDLEDDNKWSTAAGIGAETEAEVSHRGRKMQKVSKVKKTVKNVHPLNLRVSLFAPASCPIFSSPRRHHKLPAMSTTAKSIR